ncbi:MAG: hypothetical protein RBU27_04360 [Bacteroidota bacterium]|nr:hypothetical protein [Bacteroidota bacterium]
MHFVYCTLVTAFIRISFLAASIWGLVHLADAGVSQAWAQESPRDGGGVGVSAAVGIVNGVRGGLHVFPFDAVAIEAAVGYVRVNLIKENGRTEYTDGTSITLGGRWYALRDAGITPVISLQCVYVESAPFANGYRQRRIAVMPALGSEYSFLASLSFFFRFGPAFQFTRDIGETRFELVTQFDAGFAILF